MTAMERTHIPTESRAFIRRVTSNVAENERLGAGMLFDGAADWDTAFAGVSAAVIAAAGPKKGAAIVSAAAVRLQAAQKRHACFVNCSMGRSRSAFIETIIYKVARHPLVEAREEGIVAWVIEYCCGALGYWAYLRPSSPL